MKKDLEKKWPCLRQTMKKGDCSQPQLATHSWPIQGQTTFYWLWKMTTMNIWLYDYITIWLYEKFKIKNCSHSFGDSCVISVTSGSELTKNLPSPLPQVFTMVHFTFVEFPSCREAMKACDLMKVNATIRRTMKGSGNLGLFKAPPRGISWSGGC